MSFNFEIIGKASEDLNNLFKEIKGNSLKFKLEFPLDLKGCWISNLDPNSGAFSLKIADVNVHSPKESIELDQAVNKEIKELLKEEDDELLNDLKEFIELVDRFSGLIAYDQGCWDSGIQDDKLKARLKEDKELTEKLIQATVDSYVDKEKYEIEDVYNLFKWAEQELDYNF